MKLLNCLLFMLLTSIFNLFSSAPPSKTESSKDEKQKNESSQNATKSLSKILYKMDCRWGRNGGCDHLLGFGRDEFDMLSDRINLQQSKTRGDQYVNVFIWRRDGLPVTRKYLFPVTVIENVPHSMPIRILQRKVWACALYAPGIMTTAHEENMVVKFDSNSVQAAQTQSSLGAMIKSRVLPSNRLNSAKTIGQYLQEKKLNKEIRRIDLDCLSIDNDKEIAQDVVQIRARVKDEINCRVESTWIPVDTQIKDVAAELGLSYLFNKLDETQWDLPKVEFDPFYEKKGPLIAEKIRNKDFDLKLLHEHLPPEKTIEQLVKEGRIKKDSNHNRIDLEGLYNKPVQKPTYAALKETVQSLFQGLSIAK